MTFPDLQRIHNSLSSIYHCFVYYSEAPATLLQALCEELPQIDANTWQERLAWGGVYINGIVAYQDCPLKTPMKLEYYEPKVDLDRQYDYYPKFQANWIVYEDADLFVCFKPSGLSCQKAKEQQKISLFHYLSKHYQRPVHLPSRLDFSTAGLVLCSKNPATHGAVQELFVQHQIVKKYLLKIDRPVDWQELRIDQRIGRDRRHPVLRKVVTERGKQAVTDFKLLEQDEKSSVLVAQPQTGRTHQLRVHAKYGIGSAIIGDNFYGGVPAAELNLCSYYLEFTHPLTKELLKISLPIELFPQWVSKAWIEKLLKE